MMSAASRTRAPRRSWLRWSSIGELVLLAPLLHDAPSLPLQQAGEGGDERDGQADDDRAHREHDDSRRHAARPPRALRPARARIAPSSASRTSSPTVPATAMPSRTRPTVVTSATRMTGVAAPVREGGSAADASSGRSSAGRAGYGSWRLRRYWPLRRPAMGPSDAAPVRVSPAELPRRPTVWGRERSSSG